MSLKIVGKPIFSVDIHPDGSRCVTGGQGDDCGRIMVWNMQPVRSEKAEMNESVHKLLCKMDNHLGCVNCVRWSNSGKCLASCSDDKLVMIWKCTPGSANVFGSTNHEQWRVTNVLRGHSEDVLDVSWSPHDGWLASCSVDNTIIVWNMHKLPEQVALLRGHSGLVKGVTWDPVGKYLASQSDDKTLRVWRTSDWKEEACIKEPFQECCGTTHVLRLNWSPDGQYIVSAHAMNNAGPTAQIIERSAWKTSLDFVGHRKAVTCVRFNPNLLKKRLKKHKEKDTQYSCVAIGSRDKSISIWLTALKRPLVLTHDLFERSILDLSWSASGMELMSCSEDGTVCYMSFTSEELGTPISKADKDTLFRKTYGKSLFTDTSSANNQIIESSAMLNIQQKTAEEEKRKLAELPKSTFETPKKQLSTSCSTPHTPRNKQIETRTKDGKRRITPIFLAAAPDVGEAPPPFASSTEPMFSSSKEQSTIVREKIDSSELPTFPRLTPPSGSNLASQASRSPGSQSVTPSSSHVKPSIQSADTSAKKDKDKVIVHTAKRKLDTDVPGTGLEPPIKKKDGRGRPRKDKTMADNRSITSTPVHSVQKVVERETTIVYTNAGLDLTVPPEEKTSRVQVYGVPGSDSGLLVELENRVSVGAGKLHALRGVHGGDRLWETMLNSPILACTGNKHFACATCADATLHLFSTQTGSRLLPALVLDSKIHKLRTSGHYVMAITSRGTIYVWNMQTKESIIKNESMTSFVTDETLKISNILLTEQGLPVITLNIGNTYTYKTELGCWVIINSRENVLAMCSDHQSVAATSSQAAKHGPLATLQAANSKGSASRLYRSSGTVQKCATMSHLESQVANCWALKSSSEYHFWFITFVRYLAQQGDEKRLREVCEELLGPRHVTKSSKWQPSVLGHKKRSLLEECLPIIGTNLQLQRLFTEFIEQLDEKK